MKVMNSKLFVYGVAPDVFEKIKSVCRGVKVYALDDSILDQTVHEVTDIPYLLYQPSEKENAFLILDSDQGASVWKGVLNDLKRVDHLPHLIKVSVNENNAKWPMHILFEHVKSEEALFNQRNALKQHMINAAAIMQTQLSDDFKRDLSNAFRVYDDDGSTIEQLNDAINALAQYERMA